MRQGISAANYQRSRSRERPAGNGPASPTRLAQQRQQLQLQQQQQRLQQQQQRLQQQQQQQKQRKQQRQEELDRAAAEVAIRTVVSQMDNCFIAWRDLAHASWFRRMWVQFKAMKSLHEYAQRSKLHEEIRKRELAWLRDMMRQWHRIANNNRKQAEDIYSADTVRYIYLASLGLRALQAYARRQDALLAKLQGRDPAALVTTNVRLKQSFNRFKTWVARSFQQRAQLDTALDWSETRRARSALLRWYQFADSSASSAGSCRLVLAPSHPFYHTVREVQALTDQWAKRRVFCAWALEFQGCLLQNTVAWNKLAVMFREWKALCDASWFYKWYAKHKALGNLLWNARRRALCREQSHLGTTACIHLTLSNGFGRFVRSVRAQRQQRLRKATQRQPPMQAWQRDAQPVLSTPVSQAAASPSSALTSVRRRFREQLASSGPASAGRGAPDQRPQHQLTDNAVPPTAMRAASDRELPTASHTQDIAQQVQQLPIQHLSMHQPEQPSGPARVGTPRLFSWRHSSSSSSRSLQGHPPSTSTSATATATATASTANSSSAFPRSSNGLTARPAAMLTAADDTPRDANWDVL